MLTTNEGLMFTPYNVVKKQYFLWKAGDIAKNEDKAFLAVGELPERGDNRTFIGSQVYGIKVLNHASSLHSFDLLRDYRGSIFNYLDGGFKNKSITEDQILKAITGDNKTSTNPTVPGIRSKFRKIPRDPYLVSSENINYQRNWSYSDGNKNMWEMARKVYTENGTVVAEVDGVTYISPGSVYTLVGTADSAMTATHFGLVGNWNVVQVDYVIQKNQFRCNIHLNRPETITDYTKFAQLVNVSGSNV
jgi:hypothetical protein